MEQRSLRVVSTNKNFFTKLTNTISRLLIPTKLGINGIMISIKRSSLVKAFEAYKNENKDEAKKENLSKKYEDAYTLYLEAIDKYIMDSLYKKVKSNTATNFETEVLASEKPVLVDFWATWCMPCRMLAPTVEEVADETEGRAVVGKVNVDEEMELARRYRVASIPTLIVFENGAEVRRSVGVVEKEDIYDLLGLPMQE